jgi:hypothetical protein
MDLNNVVFSKVGEVAKLLQTKLGGSWKIEDIVVGAQVRISNDKGEETVANVELGKYRIKDGDLNPVLTLGQKDIEARIKEANSK